MAAGAPYYFDRSLVLNVHAAPWLEGNDWLEPDEDLRYQGSRLGAAAEFERSTPLETSAGQYHDTMYVRLHTERLGPEAVGEPFGTWSGNRPAPMKLVLATDAAGREVLVNDNGIVLTLE